MDLPFPNSSQPGTTEPPVLTPAPNRRGRGWLRLGIVGLIVAVMVVGLFFGVRAIYRTSHHTGNTQPATVSKSNKSGASNKSNPSSQSQSTSSSGTNGGTNSNSTSNTAGNAPGGSSGSSSTATGAAGSTNQPVASNGQTSNTANTSGSLTNTGPGQTIGLFAGTAMTGVVLYQVRLRKRLPR